MNDFELNEAAKRLMKNEMYKNALFLLDQIETPEFLFKKYTNSAICHDNLNWLDIAEELNKKAIGTDDLNYAALTNLGNIYFMSGRKDEALECYLKAVGLSKNTDIVVHTFAAKIYFERKEYKTALEFALKIDKNVLAENEIPRFKKEYIKVLFDIYYELKDYQNAVLSLEENMESVIEPSNIFKIINCYFRLKQYKKLFMSYFDFYLNNQEYNDLKYEAAARRAVNKRLYKKAEKFIKKVKNVKHPSLEILILGANCLKSKQYNKAIIYSQKYIDREPYDFQGYLNLALTYFELKEYEKSHPLWIRAIELSGCEEEIVRKYVRQCKKIKNQDRIIDICIEILKYKKFIDDEGYLSFIYQTLYNAYFQKKEYRKALKVLKS